MTIDYKAIGRRLKAERAKIGMSQEVLAETVGMSLSHISNIETGNTKLSLPAIIHIANALQISVDRLLCDNLLKCGTELSIDIQDTLKDCTDLEIRILSEILRSSKYAIRKNLQFVEQAKDIKMKKD